MHLSALDHLFWAAGLAGNIVLLGVLLLRHRARHFPVFTAFIAAAVLRTAVLYLVQRHGGVYAYFLAYWSLAIAVDVVLQLAVVFEIASHVFRPLGRWAPDARRGMVWLVAGSLWLAGLLTAVAAPVTPHWQEMLVSKGSFFTSTLMSELFVGMLVLSATVGLPWRTHVARIAHGLGAYSIVDIAIETAHTLYGAGYKTQTDVALYHTRMVLYLACLVYWSVTLWQQAPAPRELPAEMRKHLRNLQARVAYDLYLLRSWKKP